MIVLFLLFLLQFSLACACLAVNSDQEMGIASSAWGMADNNLKDKVQRQFDCCGFTKVSLNSTDPMGHPPCDDVSEQNPFFFYKQLQTCVKRPYKTSHIFGFSGGCLLLHESSAGAFLGYFHSAISNHLSIVISISPEWIVA